MGYVEILSREQLDSAEVFETEVLVGLSPDEVSSESDEFTDWLGGYMLTRSPAVSRHDGHSATLITLSDSGGSREVGRLVLRNDALRDARLEVKRIFDKPEQRDTFVYEVNERLVGSDEVKTIELDVTDEGWGDELDVPVPFPLNVMMAMTKGTGITYRIVRLHGPGGGWPVIAFTGKDRELRKMLVEQYGAGSHGAESVAFYMGEED